MVTIHQIAEEAGVSIATVSHVINKSRYVSPELVERVEEVIKRTGYDKKIKNKGSKLRIGKYSEIAIVVPDLWGTLYAKLVSHISAHVTEKGYNPVVYFHNDNVTQEKDILTNILSNKRNAGVIIVPVSTDGKPFDKLVQHRIPFVFLDRTVKNKDFGSVLPDGEGGIYQAASHLLGSGHEDIALIIERGRFSSSESKIKGYQDALDAYKLPFRDELVLEVDNNSYSDIEKKVKDVWVRVKPTSFIASGNRMTLNLLKVLNKLGIECPTDVSVIGFGDEEWSEIVSPPLTMVKHDTKEMGSLGVKLLYQSIESPTHGLPEQFKIPMELSIQRSTQVIGKGPFGEKTIAPEELTISKAESDKLLAGNYKVAISFHVGGTAWARLYENGIRNTLDKYGISILSITNAHFDPLLQVNQLEGLRLQQPDAIIAIPVDDEVTAKKFQSISEQVKLIFMSNVPEGMEKDQYASCVSVNEREHGQNVALLLGNYFKNEQDVKIGFIGHGAPFYGTHLRDAVAKEVIRTNFRNIEIVNEQYFHKIENTYELCKAMMEANPEITGLYISWDRPALQAIKALKELRREDVSIFTFDLDHEIATYLAKEEMVKGLSTQRPYQQGVAVGLATAKALLGQEGYKYIGVQPYVVEPKNLLKAWKDITLEPAPPEIEDIVLSKFT
ncbi:MAG TPA: LacI family DNA-binding transcriptional regulator [Paenibacillus sp.]|uniref:LacI family DNA-binding transcriptional regulator n=1 Tax=Paenibacillus sp. TaxID=58172 RepID=UPI002D181E5F|nr:LacI family DNA-binding transcriptional regulator [Paenibacillus sp.]HUC92405.1 LacI family DNA-binding transcriptional regulator [Paenibacillus sp.]